MGVESCSSDSHGLPSAGGRNLLAGGINGISRWISDVAEAGAEAASPPTLVETSQSHFGHAMTHL